MGASEGELDGARVAAFAAVVVAGRGDEGAGDQGVERRGGRRAGGRGLAARGDRSCQKDDEEKGAHRLVGSGKSDGVNGGLSGLRSLRFGSRAD